ncbi:hypothetical protein PUNSTDRAFT_130610 [Punctularia strigosozonata HHB-11173 SS5]|uniref:uncharacterized protein n=1 Tax=Punctularia strigosozonata (strain HHB-11173) TaxID=741275 RepID=UPI0004417112|nr:uncharacterized protein PUNSTDRAFT_130610 [Punctularia strigosozonata HHB-11173 SS5]EIN12357.1 hypothetical protein PUNSTDRAFT_130610 [Punctularia strigosozonata HHB-11173 SS5]
MVNATITSLRGVLVVRKVCVYFGQKRLFALLDVFNFDVQMGWDTIWFDGVKNYCEELVFDELLTWQASEADDDSHLQHAAGPSDM